MHEHQLKSYSEVPSSFLQHQFSKQYLEEKLTHLTKFKAALCGALLVASLPASAIFQNGGFETGDFTGWTTGFGINQGLQGAQPYHSGSISLGSGGSFRGAVVSGGPDLVNAPITLPYAQTRTARVNNADTGGFANFISQQDVITNADRDPSDNLLHIRFNYAVVLEDPNHSPAGQPFFFLRVRNVTKGTTLYEDFSFAGQTGTQFVPVPGNTGYQYLNWKPADVVVPNADLGDTIEVYLLASDCQPTGHSGYAYLDGFGSRVVPPGGGGSVAPIPTLSEMGFMLLGLLLAGAGATGLRRRS